jgi:transcription initiation factor TFIIIB Brf1 subunit/transcription initiation factor TFIIB
LWAKAKVCIFFNHECRSPVEKTRPLTRSSIQTNKQSLAGARSTGPGRRQTSQESREKTLEAARRRIQAMAVALKLNEHHADVAQRYFNLAITNNFIQGRRSEHVVACCLYIVCRMEKTTHMLIDFSELLQVSWLYPSCARRPMLYATTKLTSLASVKSIS